MKSVFSKNIIIFVCIFAILSLQVFSEELNSSNYKIVDFIVGSGSEQTGSVLGNYSINYYTGVPFDSRFSDSDNYQIYNEGSNFMANKPILECFGTSDDTIVQCGGLDWSSGGGMLNICGDSGCYDRARFALADDGNPEDTLYSIEIRYKGLGDNDWSEWKYLNGEGIKIIEDGDTHDINDCLTKDEWHDTTETKFNIFGLTPNTEYELRAYAIHGDFTESAPSDTGVVLTSMPTIKFDIDIGSANGENNETMPPYLVNIGTLRSGEISLSDSFIWLDIGSNANGGVEIDLQDIYSGIYSPSTDYKIESASIDLDIVDEGIGIVEFDYNSGGLKQDYLGPINFTQDYQAVQSGKTHPVGALSETGATIINSSSSPIGGGRAAIQFKSKGGYYLPGTTDYQDSVIFTIEGNY